MLDLVRIASSRPKPNMDESIEITPPVDPVHASVRPPGSKSITNRALVCAAMAGGISTLRGALDSEDTRVMIDGLRRLGISVESQDDGRTLRVHGNGGQIPASGAELFCANSGTTLRFLTALATLGRGSFRLDGTARMRERPIADLLDALNQLGACASSEMANGCPPVIVEARGLAGGTAHVRGDISSQFLTALLMAAPCAASTVRLQIKGTLVSRPYIEMTLAVMRTFGVDVDVDPPLTQFTLKPKPYISSDYTIEPDASAASYFWAAAAITRGQIRVEGLSAQSLQGDVAFVDCLGRMGCRVIEDADSISVIGGSLRGIDVDMNAISDTV